MFGLIPHLGCIGFMLAAIFGASTVMTIFRPLLLHASLFPILIVISFGFATISALLHLKLGGHFNLAGIKQRWRYLSVLYISTMFSNLILFLVVFPYAANAVDRNHQSNNTFALQTTQSVLHLKTDIPCSGHASLVTDELNQVNGINSVEFVFPDTFLVRYDPHSISESQILSLEIFRTFPAHNI